MNSNHGYCALIFLIFFSLSLAAADVEQITLADGRKLVGTYDDQTGTIMLEGPTKASIRVKRSQVVKREPYEAPVTPPQPVAPPMAQAPAPTAPVAKAQAPDDALRFAHVEAEKLRAQANRIEFEATKRWLLQEIATPVDLPEIGPDPRASEVEAHDKARALHRRYHDLKELEKQSRIAEGNEIMQVVYRVVEIREKDARLASGNLRHNDR